MTMPCGVLGISPWKVLAAGMCLIVASACGHSSPPPAHTNSVEATAATTDTSRALSPNTRDTVGAKAPGGLLGIDTMPSIDSLGALARRYPLDAAAPSAMLNVAPGSSLIDASQLHPYHRTYAVFSYPCEPTIDEPPTHWADYTDDLTVPGDSVILRVETWRHGTDPEDRDSTILDRGTLAMRSAVAHRGDWSDLRVVRNGKASFWSSDMNVPPSQSVDTTIGEPAFIGSLEILLPVTPRVYPGDAAVSYRILGLMAHPGDTPEIRVDNLAVRTVDTATAQPIGGSPRPVWVVAADYGATYWIDRETRVPLGWDVPQNESICEQKYVLRQ